MADATLIFHCTRAGINQDFGPYSVSPPVNAFRAMVQEFLPRRGWTIVSVDTV